MKRMMAYSAEEMNTFHNFIQFLDQLADELDEEHELTKEVEAIINNIKVHIDNLMLCFPNDDSTFL